MAFDAEQTDEIRAIAGALLGDLVGQNGTYGELRQAFIADRKAAAKAERDAAKAADVPPEGEVPPGTAPARQDAPPSRRIGLGDFRSLSLPRGPHPPAE